MPSRRPILLVPLLTLALGLPLILSQRIPNGISYDQKLYHYPAILQFQQSWPHADLWHYLSATTPGYHILMGTIGHFGGSIMVMQLAGLLIAMAAGLLLTDTLARITSPWLAVALAAPVVCREYFIASSAWLLPDDLGWLGVIIILRLALRRDRWGYGWLALAGLTLLGLVWVRQIHAWTAGLIWLAAFLPRWENDEADLGADALSPASTGGLRPLLLPHPREQLTRAAIALACTIPALLFLLLFARYWGGLVPPVFQGWYSGLNPSAWVFVLATFGIFAPFFAVFWWRPLATLWRERRGMVLVIALATVIAAACVPTSYDYDAGRRSGLWNFALHTPALGGRISPLMIGLALIGMAALVGLLSATARRARLLLAAAILGYAAACTANHDLFQRYMDSFVLITLGLLAAGAGGRSMLNTRVRAAGPALLALALLVSAARFVTTDVKYMSDPPPNAGGNGTLTPAEKPRPPMPPGKTFF